MIGLIFIISIRITDYYNNYFFQDIMTKLVMFYVFLSPILAGVIAYLRKHNK
ncbi:MAG: hypothetical protein KH020_03255 [Clostridiales bacterium]|nr:hypothetical protein [Clostridiales bacterium]